MRRAPSILALLLCALGSRAEAVAEPAGGGPAAPRSREVPRWRLRAALSSGFGGSRDRGATVAMFPTSFEVGARIWGPLSVDAAVTGVLAGGYEVACGEGARPNAILGVAGIRADLVNRKAGSWLDPFVEVHGGVGRQGVVREVNGQCAGRLFGSGGARLGLDVWLGRAAVTLALAFDYLPTASPLSLALGLSYILY